MIDEALLTVSLRQQALAIPSRDAASGSGDLRESTAGLIANLKTLGFGVSELAKDSLNELAIEDQLRVWQVLRQVMRVDANWTPLVKQWDIPTGETRTDHLVTWFVNLIGGRGTELPCGHVIPPGTFPLERYNGCPFCGTPFTFSTLTLEAQGSKLKVLELWDEPALNHFYTGLITSKIPLDATQRESLTTLASRLPWPGGEVTMKETQMLLIDPLLASGKTEIVSSWLRTPRDILRWLWFRKTGSAQIIKPAALAQRKAALHKHAATWLDESAQALAEAKVSLKLRYPRSECARIARILNNLEMTPAAACEDMHPKRGMWVRFIRALRLPEFARRPGFEKLRKTLDLFYREAYPVYLGELEKARLTDSRDRTLALLTKRPGLFARALFSTMLRFGAEPTLEAFTQVLPRVPTRLIFSLNSVAEYYFSGAERVVKTSGGHSKRIPANPLIALYSSDQIAAMKDQIEDLCLEAARVRFAAAGEAGGTMYIDPALFKIPFPTGDRSDTVQDLPSALMGARLPVEGDSVRLFMQWGIGLSAQHLDMDLSCRIVFEDASRAELCSFSNLSATGCKHSGDVRAVPDQIGAVEYIELSLRELAEAGAQYVVFIGNSYSVGAMTGGLVVGWMDSAHPLMISESGVAYDPSTVQQRVRIENPLTKALVFGVLEVFSREIIWLEMPFAGQIAQQADLAAVRALLKKLGGKLTIGNLLLLKAEAQNTRIVDDLAEADTAYTADWARNSAAVAGLLPE